MKPKAVAMLDTKHSNEGGCPWNIAGQVDFLATLLDSSQFVISIMLPISTQGIHVVLAWDASLPKFTILIKAQHMN